MPTLQSVRRTAYVLKNKGFVEFHDNPNHQRAKLVKLTKQGRSVLEQVTKLQIDWSNRITRDLSESKLNSVAQLLRTLSDRL